MTMSNKIITGADYLDWVKEHPLNLDKPLCKKPRYLDKVWVSFSEGEAHEAWVLSLTGGDFETSMTPEIFGDRIKFFFPPKSGEKFYKGLHTWWLMDIGIGKTKEECHASYCKHDWFKRSKNAINTHRFWAAVRNKTKYISHEL